MPGMLSMMVRRRRSLSACASSAPWRPVTSKSRPISSTGSPSASRTNTARSRTQRGSPSGGDDAVLGLGGRRSRRRGRGRCPRRAGRRSSGWTKSAQSTSPATMDSGVAAEQRPEPLAQERGAPGLPELAAVGGSGQAGDEAQSICSRSRSASSAVRSSVMSLTKPSRYSRLAVVAVDADAALPDPLASRPSLVVMRYVTVHGSLPGEGSLDRSPQRPDGPPGR